MPGSIDIAAPATVLPWGLSKSFGRAQEIPVIENEYRNGESQRSRLADVSRKQWSMARRLTPTALAALRTFYNARNGPTEPFYFYDPWDSEFSYDATGEETTGRYTVRFDGSWDQVVGMGRAEVPLRLMEIY